MWESERLISVKLVVFSLGPRIWDICFEMFRRKPFIPFLLFISCSCSGLGSSVYCCCGIYHRKLGGTVFTDVVGRDRKMCDVCLDGHSLLLQEVAHLSREAQSQDEAMAQLWNRLSACFAFFRARFLVWLLAGTSAEFWARIHLPGLPHSMVLGVQRGSVPRKWYLLLWLTRGSHIGSLMPQSQTPMSRFRMETWEHGSELSLGGM